MKHKTKADNSTQVRIIGGQQRGRLVQFCAIDGLRPTPDRLRETLFNWLMGHLLHARVLDVCAGSGVLAFESLSRGADSAVLIEANPTQARQLSKQAGQLGLSANTIIHTAYAQSVLPTLQGTFDVIFIDPPYAQALWHMLLDGLFNAQLLHSDSLIYVEADKPLDNLSDDFALKIHKSTKVGQIYAYLFTPILLPN